MTTQHHTLKIAIAVHGRFYSFDLARALLAQGHHVVVFTNYPRWAAKKFGLPAQAIRSFWLHGLLSKISYWLKETINLPLSEAWLHRSFGRWVKKALAKDRWDVVQIWTGIAEEFLSAPHDAKTVKILCRGSTHIKTQSNLMREESKRAAMPVEGPSPWMVAREEREYALSDSIMVLSRFAHDSFLREGVESKKLLLLPLGVSNTTFCATDQIIEARCKRLLEKKPLRILYTGTLSLRKGMFDLKNIVSTLDAKKFQFRLVGKATREISALRLSEEPNVQIIAPQAEGLLPHLYAWADIYLFPTIEDGSPTVLNHAHAAGLPILCTVNCSAPEIIQENLTGWLLPIRAPELFAQRLRWCESHRQDLASMTRFIHAHVKKRDWADVARDFTGICEDVLNARVT